MKCVRRMERSLRVVGFVCLGVAIDIVSVQKFALSQTTYPKTVDSVDYLCYIQTSDGQVINLSGLCGASRPMLSSTNSTLSIGEESFLQRYQGFLEKRASSPGVQAIIAQAQQNPQSVIQRAQAVCSALRNGLPQRNSGQADDDLFQTMAPKYFCPDLDD